MASLDGRVVLVSGSTGSAVVEFLDAAGQPLETADPIPFVVPIPLPPTATPLPTLTPLPLPPPSLLSRSPAPGEQHQSG